jgi:hypothetical protein
MIKKMLILKEKYRRWLDLRILILLAVLLLIFLKYKNIFFVILFIFIDILLIVLTREFDVFNPIKIMDFAVFMCSFAYGATEGFILMIASIILLPLSGKFTLYKLLVNLALVIQIIGAVYLRFLPVIFAGIIILFIRFAILFIINLALFGDLGTPKKLIKEVLDLSFWTIFFLLFGSQIYRIML